MNKAEIVEQLEKWSDQYRQRSDFGSSTKQNAYKNAARLVSNHLEENTKEIENIKEIEGAELLGFLPKHVGFMMPCTVKPIFPEEFCSTEKEKRKIPQWLHDWIGERKKHHPSDNAVMLENFIRIYKDEMFVDRKMKWIKANKHLAFDVILNGNYEVHEPLYNLIDPVTNQIMVKMDKGVIWISNAQDNNRFTEQEIIEIDPKLWEYRKEVE